MHSNHKASFRPVLHGISSLAADVRVQKAFDDHTVFVGTGCNVETTLSRWWRFMEAFRE